MAHPYALLYRSLATTPFSDLELRALSTRAAQRNARGEITGLLLHGQMEHVPGLPGAFVQWIEGPEAAVRTLYTSIQLDPRHHQLEVLSEGPALRSAARAGRLFPDWAMEFESISDLPATLSGFLRYVRRKRAGAEGLWRRAA